MIVLTVAMRWYWGEIIYSTRCCMCVCLILVHASSYYAPCIHYLHLITDDSHERNRTTYTQRGVWFSSYSKYRWLFCTFFLYSALVCISFTLWVIFFLYFFFVFCVCSVCFFSSAPPGSNILPLPQLSDTPHALAVHFKCVCLMIALD